MTGSDVSEPALGLARANGAKLGLKVAWMHADLLEGMPDEYDALLCNPPYVAESRAGHAGAGDPPPRAPRRRCSLAPTASVRSARCSPSWPPASACASPHWRSAPDRRPQSAELMRGAGFHTVRVERDLAGIQRVVVGERGE